MVIEPAVLARNLLPGSGVCFRCGKKGHSFRECTQPKPTHPTSTSISYLFMLQDDSSADELKRLEEKVKLAREKRAKELKAELARLGQPEEKVKAKTRRRIDSRERSPKRRSRRSESRKEKYHKEDKTAHRDKRAATPESRRSRTRSPRPSPSPDDSSQRNSPKPFLRPTPKRHPLAGLKIKQEPKDDDRDQQQPRAASQLPTRLVPREPGGPPPGYKVKAETEGTSWDKSSWDKSSWKKRGHSWDSYSWKESAEPTVGKPQKDWTGHDWKLFREQKKEAQKH